jgi:hypothetical protein
MTTATEDQPVGTTGPLEGRAALVTGPVRGIASAASRHLAADGAQVPSGLATSYHHRTHPGRRRRPRYVR